ETLWYYAVEPGAEVCKRPQNKAGPKHILAEEETEVGKPGRSKEALPGLGRKDYLERSKDKDQEEKAEAGGKRQRGQVHWDGPLEELWAALAGLHTGGRLGARWFGRRSNDEHGLGSRQEGLSRLTWAGLWGFGA